MSGCCACSIGGLALAGCPCASEVFGSAATGFTGCDWVTADFGCCDGETADLGCEVLVLGCCGRDAATVLETCVLRNGTVNKSSPAILVE